MYELEWAESALSQLADEWLKADSPLRDTVNAAVHEVEQRLMRRPDIVGESRDPGTRVLILNPLTVTFHVNVRTKIVLISGVRVSRRRS
jgi:hypothetical protein